MLLLTSVLRNAIMYGAEEACVEVGARVLPVGGGGGGCSVQAVTLSVTKVYGPMLLPLRAAAQPEGATTRDRCPLLGWPKQIGWWV